MKYILLCSIFFCAIALPALGELTDADLDKIRLIVKEEIEPIKDDIVTLKTDGTAVKTEVSNVKENVKNGFGDVQKNFDRQNNIIIACIGFPMAILAIGATVWGIIANKRSKKDSEQVENTLTREQAIALIGEHMREITPEEKQIFEALMREQNEKIESLTQEIETLKQQRTVNP